MNAADAGAWTMFALLLVRPGALVLAAPVFSGAGVPMPVRIGLVIALAAAAAPAAAGVVRPDPVWLLVAAGGEMAVGLAMALAVRVVLAAAEMGGHLVGFQMGLSYAATVDPQTGARNNVLAHFYGAIALLVFFAINGHHALIGALVGSYGVVPLAGAGLSGDMLAPVTSLLGMVFFHGLRISAPVVTALLLVELGLGLIARAAPALNLMVVGAPVRSIVGMLALSVALQSLPGAVLGGWPAARDAAWRLVSALR